MADLGTAVYDATGRLELTDWQRLLCTAQGLDPDQVQRFLNTPGALYPRDPDDRELVGDPTLGGDGLRIAIDADCPSCGWPERFYDTLTRRFGCVRCTYRSDERNA